MSKDMTDQQFVEMIVKAIVENPDDVKTERTVDDKGVLISLMLNPEDMGKVIGKGGRTVNSIRKLLHVFGAKSDERVNLKIFEPDGGEVPSPDDNGDHDVVEPLNEKPAKEEKAPEAEVVEDEKVEEEVEEKKDDRLKDVDEEVLV
jgi:predicted RNA-binding protein YlqC (UPF0109 family)